MKRDPVMTHQTIVDPAKVTPRVETATEAVWHHELVGARLIEAASVVRRMPMRIWPKQFGTAWPHFQAMTSGELQALKNEIMQTGGAAALAAWEREQNRVRIPPSGQEIERCEQALGWVPKYLGQDQETAQAVSFWATKTYDIDSEEIPAFVRAGLREISRGLRRDRVPVRT
jgi:hypothetical protein